MSGLALGSTGTDASAVPTSLANPAFTAGKAIGGAFRTSGRNALAFGLVAAVFFWPAVLVEMAAQGGPEPSRIGTMLWNVLGCLTTAALTRGTLDSLDGRAPRLSALFGAGLGRGLPVLGASMLVGLITLLGLALAIVPGLIAAAGLYVAAAAVVAEPGKPVSACLQRSWSLTRGHRWGVLGVLLLFFAFPIAVSFAQAVLVEVFGDLGARAVLALGGILLAAALGLQAVAAAAVYHGLRAEKEGLAAPRLGAVFE